MFKAAMLILDHLFYWCVINLSNIIQHYTKVPSVRGSLNLYWCYLVRFEELGIAVLIFDSAKKFKGTSALAFSLLLSLD